MPWRAAAAAGRPCADCQAAPVRIFWHQPGCPVRGHKPRWAGRDPRGGTPLHAA